MVLLLFVCFSASLSVLFFLTLPLSLFFIPSSRDNNLDQIHLLSPNSSLNWIPLMPSCFLSKYMWDVIYSVVKNHCLLRSEMKEPYKVKKASSTITVAFTFMHLADAFIQSDLHCIQVTVLHFISSCFPWESNP